MKTCPVCHETYSERIDFCFNDGEVLALLPSAMDAPMPRLVGLVPPRPPGPTRADAADAPGSPAVAAAAGVSSAVSAPVGSSAAPSAAAEASAADAPPMPQAAPSTLVGAEPPIRPARSEALPDQRPDAREEEHGVVAPAPVSPADPRSAAPAQAAPQPAPPSPQPRVENRPAPVAPGPGASGSATSPASANPSSPPSSPPSSAPAAPPAPVVPAQTAAQAAAKPAAQAPKGGPAGPIKPKAPEQERGSSATSWFVAAFTLAIAAVVLSFTLWKPVTKAPPASSANTPKPAAIVTPPSTPAPQAPMVATPTAPSQIAPVAPITPTPVAPTDAVPTPPPPGVVITTSPKNDRTAPPTETVVAVPAPTPSTPPAAGSPWDAPAAVSSGYAFITSDPSGASVKIDGKSRGSTPLQVQLEYGTYNVELDLAGYLAVRRRIDVQSPEPKFPYTLQREVRRGSVLVVFEGWDGATLEVDGELKGQLPANIVLSEGMHQFVVTGSRGEVRLRREVSLAQQGLTKLFLQQ